mmetsp:Transcript_66350/g.205566  ORF Transcript_66350/g.205566 Transcript_66350/m.205566 type:complete len:303 (-) Transcript_66350:630-1538(-)
MGHRRVHPGHSVVHAAKRAELAQVADLVEARLEGRQSGLFAVVAQPLHRLPEGHRALQLRRILLEVTLHERVGVQPDVAHGLQDGLSEVEGHLEHGLGHHALHRLHVLAGAECVAKLGLRGDQLALGLQQRGLRLELQGHQPLKGLLGLLRGLTLGLHEPAGALRVCGLNVDFFLQVQEAILRIAQGVPCVLHLLELHLDLLLEAGKLHLEAAEKLLGVLALALLVHGCLPLHPRRLQLGAELCRGATCVSTGGLCHGNVGKLLAEFGAEGYLLTRNAARQHGVALLPHALAVCPGVALEQL